MHTKTWHVEIHLSDHGDGRVGAEAVLRTDSGTEVRHRADAHLGTIGQEVPEIAEELAACRALSGLVEDLLHATEDDLRVRTW